VCVACSRAGAGARGHAQDATLGADFFDDRRWASQEAVKKEERLASERRKKQKKVRWIFFR
jgi:hypothetical protein